MAVEQIRPVEGQRKAAQRKTPELNVDTAIRILFGTSRLEGDSFISTLRYARNEGRLEQRNDNGPSARDADQGMNRNTTGLSSANKEHSEIGASSAGSDTGSATTTKSAVSHNDPTTKGRTSGKEHNEAPNR
jgi:hypothetical protein